MPCCRRVLNQQLYKLSTLSVVKFRKCFMTFIITILPRNEDIRTLRLYRSMISVTKHFSDFSI